MSRTLTSRNLYVRITDEAGKRKYVNVGLIRPDGSIKLFKGMPLTGWFEV